ncbi:MAG: SDR family NAD(P)-dependent oxidoreductase [Egibacteraceae bacterium]
MRPIAILTGGSRGIGKAILGRLIVEGYECLVFGLSPLAALYASSVTFIRRDLSMPSEVLAAASDVERYLLEAARPAELLVNNAGGAWPCPVEDLRLPDVQRDVMLNLLAPMLLSQAVLPRMRLSGRGSIVNIGSIAGRPGVRYLHAYGAAKAGLVAFTQSIAAEVADDGVRVNCVVPGAVDTESARAGRQEISRLLGLDPEEYEKSMIARTGLSRLLDPDEVAAAVLWLAQPEQRALTGQAINVCGTMVMG